MKSNRKTLVVYYSYSGNTHTIAQYVQQAAEADIFEVLPIDAYPEDYNTVVNQAKKEIYAQFKPAIQSLMDNLAQYDTVYIGSPCWCSTIAPPLATFLSQSDLSGKTIRPFMTHEGSFMGRSLADLKSFCPQSTFLSALPIFGHSVNEAQSEVEKWVKSEK